MTTASTINCKKCNKVSSEYTFKMNADDCDKKQCWLQCGKARKAMAEACNKEAVDFLPAITGKIKMHEEKEYKPVTPNGSRFIDGRWVPWGQDVSEYWE